MERPRKSKTLKTPLAAAVRLTRVNQRLTQRQLAILSGLGLRFIRELEQGKKTLRLDKVQNLLTFLGLEMRIEPRKPPIGRDKK